MAASIVPQSASDVAVDGADEAGAAPGVVLETGAGRALLDAGADVRACAPG
jgi:hypothetical protein